MPTLNEDEEGDIADDGEVFNELVDRLRKIAAESQVITAVYSKRFSNGLL